MTQSVESGIQEIGDNPDEKWRKTAPSANSMFRRVLTEMPPPTVDRAGCVDVVSKVHS